MLMTIPTAALLLGLVLGGDGPDLALRGLDPVQLCEGHEMPGQEELEVTHGRYTYRFADEASRTRFLEAPERWGIQWGGGCGRMGPLSGVGSPDRWAVYEGHIYIFASDGCREGFLAAPERFAVRPEMLPPVDAAAREAGAAWIEKSVAAHGGAAAIDAAHAQRLVFQGPSGEYTRRIELVVAADTGEVLRRSVWIPHEPEAERYDSSWVLAEASFSTDGDDVVAVTSPDQLADIRRYAHRELLPLLWARRGDDFLALHMGAHELAGEPVENVLVHFEGLTTTLHLHPENGRVRGISWRGRPNDGVTRHVVETFRAWDTVDGVLVPTARTVTVDGEEKETLAIAWNATELLPDVPSEAFRRP